TRLRLSLRNRRARRRLVLPGADGGGGVPPLLQGQDRRRVRPAHQPPEARRARSLPLARRGPPQQGVCVDDGNRIMTPLADVAQALASIDRTMRAGEAV